MRDRMTRHAVLVGNSWTFRALTNVAWVDCARTGCAEFSRQIHCASHCAARLAK